MILRYKTNNSSEVMIKDSDTMTVFDKLVFIGKVFNFDIIVLDSDNKSDDALRLEILNGKF